MEEARRGYPVHLKAVVTYYDPVIDPRRPALFVHDATGAVFVALSSFPANPLKAGALVEITGVSAAGDFAPIVNQASAQVIGQSSVPADAPRVSLGQMLTGGYDGQWVEVEGIVRSVSELGGNVSLDIAVSDGNVSATTVKAPGADYASLVDAKIRIHANAAPAFNRNLQLTGVHLLFPGLDQVKIDKPAIADPFTLPILPIDELLRYVPNVVFRHRVHVRGPMTLQWPGRSLCIQNADRGLCIQTTQTEPVTPGEIVDVAGFPVVGGFSPTLSDAVYRSTRAWQPVAAAPITAEQALRGDNDTRLVEIEGRLIGQDRGTKDQTMVLSSGNFLVPVVLPPAGPANGAPGHSTSGWEAGSILRITGICSAQLDPSQAIREGFSNPTSFRILLPSLAGVVVVRKASWWTPAHLLPALALVLAATLCVLGWVMALRHRIAAQAVLIRIQNATLKDLSFQDGLTGVANRRKFDEILELEFARAVESGSYISLLMIDIDHFKLLNDQYGHQCGDECLIRIAHALGSATLRTSDLLARYGGEEFAVIMPSSNESGAVAAAERMRAAVRVLSIAHASSPLNQSVSVSVGAATMKPVASDTPAALIALADQALYTSKLQGRNRTTCASLAMTALAIPGPAM